jgi:hypothetical protein
VSHYAEKVRRRDRLRARELSRVPQWPDAAPARRVRTDRAVIRQGPRTVLVRWPLRDQYGDLFGFYGVGHGCTFWRFA